MQRLFYLGLSCAICTGSALAQPGDAAPSPGLLGKFSPHGQPAASATVVSPSSSTPAPATLVVKLPASAILKVDGKKSGSGASQRTFTSAPLPAGQSHEFKLEAELINKGQKVTVALSVNVNAGETIEMPLEVNGAAGQGDASSKTK
jgi:uncharacterized protein (TIGR03000 family)